MVTLKKLGVDKRLSATATALQPEQAIERVKEKSGGELTKAAVIREVIKAPARAAKQQKIAERENLAHKAISLISVEFADLQKLPKADKAADQGPNLGIKLVDTHAYPSRHRRDGPSLSKSKT
jgi:hypothetical protein